MRPDVAYWTEDQKTDDLRWYRYLFSNRSKPSTHLRALSRLSDEELAACPPALKALLEFIRERIRP